MSPKRNLAQARAAFAPLFFILTCPVPSVAQELLDVAYVSGGAEKQRLDLYLPQALDVPKPVVLLVHGGSLWSGDRKDSPWPRRVCEAFAAEGVACAAISYRLYPQVDWPAPAQDVAAAFAWLHSNVASYGGDPRRIVLVGHSSGCLLSTLVVSNPSLLAPYGLGPSDVFGVVAIGCRLDETPPDTTGVSAERVAQAFAAGGTYENFGSLDNLRSYYPMTHLGAHVPPFLALIAEGERSKPPILEDAATYVGLARDCRVDADLAILPNRTHMTAVEELVSREDPSFLLIMAFVHRLSEVGPRTHLADPDRCPTPIR